MRFDRAGFPFIGGAWLLALARGAVRRLGARAAVRRARRVLRVLLPRSRSHAARRARRRAVAGRRPRAGRRRRRWPAPRPPGDWQQISIFLSPMDVHVNRMPASGRVTQRQLHARAGSCPRTATTRRPTNERSEIWIDHGGQTVVARQIVGILARRVVCRAQVGRRRARRRPLRRHEIRLADGRLPAADRHDHGAGRARWSAAAKRSSRCYTERRELTAVSFQPSIMLEENEGRLRFLRRSDRSRAATGSAAASTCCPAC